MRFSRSQAALARSRVRPMSGQPPKLAGTLSTWLRHVSRIGELTIERGLLPTRFLVKLIFACTTPVCLELFLCHRAAYARNRNGGKSFPCPQLAAGDCHSKADAKAYGNAKEKLSGGSPGRRRGQASRRPYGAARGLLREIGLAGNGRGMRT
jgi:hypothetical protein